MDERQGYRECAIDRYAVMFSTFAQPRLAGIFASYPSLKRLEIRTKVYEPLESNSDRNTAVRLMKSMRKLRRLTLDGDSWEVGELKH